MQSGDGGVGRRQLSFQIGLHVGDHVLLARNQGVLVGDLSLERVDVVFDDSGGTVGGGGCRIGGHLEEAAGARAAQERLNVAGVQGGKRGGVERELAGGIEVEAESR